MTSFEGQLYQAMFFSHGGGLTEEFIYDKPTGVKLSTNMFEFYFFFELMGPWIEIQGLAYLIVGLAAGTISLPIFAMA